MVKKKPSLGKGLDALLGDKGQKSMVDSSALSTDSYDGKLREINISSIVVSPHQPRKTFSEDELQQLSYSIKQQGVLQPVIVREQTDGDYQLVAGERRWRAAQKAGLDTIPAMINDWDDSTCGIVALLENVQRQDLNPVELSDALCMLNKEHDMTHQDIADALSMSRPAVSNLLRLAELPSSIKDMLRNGHLDMGHARAILSAEAKDQLGLARHIADKHLTVRQTEELVKKWPLDNKSSTIGEEDPDILAFARRCTEALSLQVSIKHKSNGGGKLMISYDSLEQLHHLTARLVPELADNDLAAQEEL